MFVRPAVTELVSTQTAKFPKQFSRRRLGTGRSLHGGTICRTQPASPLSWLGGPSVFDHLLVDSAAKIIKALYPDHNRQSVVDRRHNSSEVT
jgi:hypothetical protein